MNLKTILLGLSLVAFCAAGHSQTTKKQVNKRQVTQAKKINQGVKSGELTKKEAVELKAQQRNINQTKKAAKADGVVTPKEKAIIKHKQNKAAKNIAKKKHNKVDRK
jgi:hypothetical protein